MSRASRASRTTRVSQTSFGSRRSEKPSFRSRLRELIFLSAGANRRVIQEMHEELTIWPLTFRNESMESDFKMRIAFMFRPRAFSASLVRKIVRCESNHTHLHTYTPTHKHPYLTVTCHNLRGRMC